jgi:tetratricopeptide (TPR) repeat protein
MAQILKLPVETTKLGYRRVRKRCKGADNPNQLDLFPASKAKILEFSASGLSTFEQALISDERGDARAAELYSKAIEQQDCVADAFCNLGIIESQRGNVLKAFDCFTTCLKNDPRHTEAHYNLANLYFDQNDFRLARLHFEMATEIEPEFANAYFNLALVLALNDEPERAADALKKYQQLVSEEEGRGALQSLESLKKSVTAARNSRLSSG